jgi:chromosome segregation ATPase
LDGEDYLELKEALESLLKVPGMNENTAFISAFTTLQTKGLTKQRCLESIDYYVEELNKEKEMFRQAQSTKYDNNVASIDNEINDLNTQNEEAAAEIQRLTEQIETNNAQIAEKTTVMNANKAELEQEQANFDATLSHFVTSLETDKSKIVQYLGSTTNTPEQA